MRDLRRLGRQLVELGCLVVGASRQEVLIGALLLPDALRDSCGRAMCLGRAPVGSGRAFVRLEAVALRLECSQQGMFDVRSGRRLTRTKAINTIGEFLGALVDLASPRLGALVKIARLGHAQE
jgi:hypothetical protein